MIDSAEACQRLAALRQQLHSEAAIAAAHGLSSVSFAIYELLDQRPRASSASPSFRLYVVLASELVIVTAAAVHLYCRGRVPQRGDTGVAAGAVTPPVSNGDTTG